MGPSYEIGSLRCIYDSRFEAMYQQTGKQFTDNFRISYSMRATSELPLVNAFITLEQARQARGDKLITPA